MEGEQTYHFDKVPAFMGIMRIQLKILRKSLNMLDQQNQKEKTFFGFQDKNNKPA
jgi:hypothetical protein